MAGKTYTIEIELDSSDAVAGIKKIDKEVDKLKGSAKEATERIEMVGDSAKKAGRDAKQMSASFKNAFTIIKTAGKGALIGLGVQLLSNLQVLQDFADWTAKVGNTLSSAAKSAYAMATANKSLAESIDDVVVAWTKQNEIAKESEIQQAAFNKSMMEYGQMIGRVSMQVTDMNKPLEERRKLIDKTQERELELYEQEQLALKNRRTALDLQFKDDEQNQEYRLALIELETDMMDLENEHQMALIDFRQMRNDLTAEEYITRLEIQDEIRDWNQEQLDMMYEQNLTTAFNMNQRMEREENFKNWQLEQWENEKTQLIEQGDFTIELQNEYAAREIQLTEDTEARKLALRKAGFQNTVQIAQMSLGAVSSMLGAVSQLYAEDFERQNQIQIAQATVDTIGGAIAAFMGAQSLGQPWGAIIGAVLAAAVLVAGYAQIQQIRSTSPESPSSPSNFGGGAGAAATVPAAPSFSLIQPLDAGNQQVSEQISDANNETRKSYVVGDEVSSQQSLDRQIDQNATI